jgi:hypothetical protein
VEVPATLGELAAMPSTTHGAPTALIELPTKAFKLACIGRPRNCRWHFVLTRSAEQAESDNVKVAADRPHQAATERIARRYCQKGEGTPTKHLRIIPRLVLRGLISPDTSLPPAEERCHPNGVPADCLETIRQH